MIKAFLKEIKNLNYVIQRNWENFPDGYVEGHEDFDLFVAEEEKEVLLKIAKKYPDLKVDVRSLSDNYYPKVIGEILLVYPQLMKELFWVPNLVASFLSLYYHNLVHKEGNPYKEKLDKLFKMAYPPVKCKDEGVGHFV